MRVAYVGNHEPEFSTEQDVAKAFRALGHEVVELQENRSTWQQVRDAAFNSDLLFITGTWDEAQPLPQTLDTLRQCAMRGIPTATLHLDVFSGVTGVSANGGYIRCSSPAMCSRPMAVIKDWARLGVDPRWLRPAVRHDAVHKGK